MNCKGHILFVSVVLILGMTLVMVWQHRQRVIGMGTKDYVIGLENASHQARMEHIVFNSFDNSKPCTHKILQEYFKDNHHFPSGGKWKAVSDKDYFQSDICKFSAPRIRGDELKKCILKANIGSIVTMGDSNGMRMGGALSDYVKILADQNCTGRRHENCVYMKPDINYYNDTDADWTKFLAVSLRHCACCGGGQHVCHIENESGVHNVKYQHIGLTEVVDDSVQLRAASVEDRVKTDKIWAPTFPEFVFRYYLRDRYPDLLIIFLPFNHAKRMTTERVAIDMIYFKLLAKLYIPKTTKIFYMPAFAEFESARKDNKEWFNKRFENKLATEKIDELNRRLFSIIEDDLLQANGNTFGFIDSLHISLSRSKWSGDSVHMQPIWYETVMSMFWDLFCNSVEYDEFGH